MTDRIDHAAEARRLMDLTGEGYVEHEGWTETTALMATLDAQTHATLALVEQQRLANLLQASYTLGSGEALSALRVNIGDGDAPKYRLRPEIAALLDLTPDDGIVDAEIHCAGCQCPPDPCPYCGSTDVLSAVHLVDCPGPS